MTLLLRCRRERAAGSKAEQTGRTHVSYIVQHRMTQRQKKNEMNLFHLLLNYSANESAVSKLLPTVKNDYEVPSQLGPNWLTKADASAPREAGPCAVSDCFFFHFKVSLPFCWILNIIRLLHCRCSRNFRDANAHVCRAANTAPTLLATRGQ